MNSNEIDIYLRVLDEELEKRPIRKPVRIVVVGGVYMLFFLRNLPAPTRLDERCCGHIHPIAPGRISHALA